MKNMFKSLLISIIIVVAIDMIAIMPLRQLAITYSWMGSDLIDLSNQFIGKVVVDSMPTVPGLFAIIEITRWIMGIMVNNYEDEVSELEEEEA